VARRQLDTVDARQPGRAVRRPAFAIRHNARPHGDRGIARLLDRVSPASDPAGQRDFAKYRDEAWLAALSLNESRPAALGCGPVRGKHDVAITEQEPMAADAQATLTSHAQPLDSGEGKPKTLRGADDCDTMPGLVCPKAARSLGT